MTRTKPTHRREIIARSQDLLDEMTETHNKILPVRMDFHFPEGYQHDGGNTEIQRLHKRLAQHDRYHDTDSRYITVREQDTSAVPHYHSLILVDGNKHQKARGLQDAATTIWLDIVGSDQRGLVDRCLHKEGHSLPPLEMIRRPSSLAADEQLEQQTVAFERAKQVALDHAEYLAKERTKGDAPDGAREMLASQVKPHDRKGKGAQQKPDNNPRP